MELRVARAQDQEAVQNLWDYCFEHKDDPFFRYYFEKAYRAEDTMVGEIDGQVQAMVHLHQVPLVIRQQTMPVSYVIGVATDPVLRSQRVGKAILTATLAECRRRGQALTILMPSKAGFYQPYGWALYCHQWVTRMSLEDLRPLINRDLSFGRIVKEGDWRQLAPVYEAYTAKYSGYVRRGEKEWSLLLGSLLAEGAQIAYVYGDEGVEGYMFFSLGGEEIFVSEFVYSSRRGQRALLHYLYNHRSQGQSVRWNEGLGDEGYLFMPNGKEGHETMPYMMGRVVDVEQAFAAVQGEYLGEDCEAVLQVNDPLCSWNDGDFELISKGAEIRASQLSPEENRQIDVQCTVGGLSLLLFGRLSVDELLFEGELIVHTARGAAMVDQLRQRYRKCPQFINEWW